MSYDIRFAVKDERGKYMVVFQPYHCNPAYSYGQVVRKATGWDFVQGEYYRVSEVLPCIKHGIQELTSKPEKYERFARKHKLASACGTLECLEGIVGTLNELLDGLGWNDYDTDYLYIAW